jgi:hypothetical protein
LEGVRIHRTFDKPTCEPSIILGSLAHQHLLPRRHAIANLPDSPLLLPVRGVVCRPAFVPLSGAVPRATQYRIRGARLVSATRCLCCTIEPSQCRKFDQSSLRRALFIEHGGKTHNVLAQQRRRKPHLHGLWFGLTMTWYRLHHRLEKLYATSAQLLIGCTQLSRSFPYHQAAASDRTWTNCRGHMESAAALPEGASSVLHSYAGLSRPSCTELPNCRAWKLPLQQRWASPSYPRSPAPWWTDARRIRRTPLSNDLPWVETKLSTKGTIFCNR